MCEAETEQDRPLLILSPGLFTAAESVTALLSSGNRWANGSRHPRGQQSYTFWNLSNTIFTDSSSAI